MLVFVSSSTDLSREAATLLRHGIGNLDNTIDVFMPSHDIKDGEYFQQGILDAIKESKLAIFCLSQDSLRSGWLGYVVGLFSGINQSPIVCLLIDLPISDLPSPLSNFEAVRTDPASLKRLGSFILDLAEPTAGGGLATSPRERHEKLLRQLPAWAEHLSRDINAIVAKRAHVDLENSPDHWVKALKSDDILEA